MSETTTTIAPAPLVVEEGESKPGFAGTSVPRKEDKRLLQGEGVFFDDVKRHGMETSTSSARRTRTQRSSRSTCRKRSSWAASTGR